MSFPNANNVRDISRCALGVMLAVLPLSAYTAPFSWDPGQTPATPSGGAGTWDTTSAFWADGGADFTWANGGADSAIFGGTAGTVTIGGSTINVNSLNLNTSGYLITGGTLNLSGATPTITSGAGVATTLSSLLTGSTGLTMAGSGSLTIDNSSNSFTGGILVNAGNLITNTAGSLGANVITLNGGSFSPRANLANNVSVTANSTIHMNQTSSTFTLGGLAIGGQTLSVNTSSSVSNGHVNFTGTTVLSGNATISNSRASSSISQTTANITLGDVTVADSVAGSTTTTLTITSQGAGVTRSRVTTLNGVISDNATDSTKIMALNVTAGTWTPLTVNVGGANTYSGATTIGGGGANATLRLITGNNRLPVGTNLTIHGGAASNGTLNLNSFDQTVGSLNGGAGTVRGTVTNGASGTGTSTLTVSSTTLNSSFAGLIQDGATAKVALTKAGAGTTLTLTGANTYTGATTVNGGTLLVSGSLAAGSAVTVNNSGVLGGAGGTIAGTVSITSGGAIAPGAGNIGTLDSGAFTLQSGGTFRLELDTNNASIDLLNVAGDLSLAGGSLLAISDLGGNQTLAVGTSFVFLDYSGTWNGGLFTYNSSVLNDDGLFTLGANTYQISYNGLDDLSTAVTLEVMAVPEPSAYALLVMAGGVVLLRRRRVTR